MTVGAFNVLFSVKDEGAFNSMVPAVEVILALAVSDAALVRVMPLEALIITLTLILPVVLLSVPEPQVLQSLPAS
jgi:hypothetical protein